MPFNIKTEKILSPSNIKKIIALGISLRDEMEALEKSIISEYDETKTYSKGDCFFYNGYLYRTKYTTTGVFDESKVEKIGDNLELIDKADIEAMLGLTTDELQTLSSIILDSEVRLDKTFSSSKIYTDLQQCLNDSKTFTLSKLASTMTASFEIATSTADMTEGNILYLLNTGTNTYDIYALIGGNPTVIASTTIDLSNYYTKTEIDNDFVKKTDADGKYALITTVSNHISDNSVHFTSQAEKDKMLISDNLTDTIDENSTSTDIASAKGVYDELKQKVDKSSIVTSIDKTSTDDTVPSALSIYNRVGIKIYNSFSQLGLTMGSETLIDIGKTMEEKSMGLFEIISGCNTSEYPYTYGTLIVFKANDNRVVFNFYPTSDTTLTGREYVASYHGAKDLLLPWKQIQTEPINDIPSTKIELDSTLFTGGSVYYEVRNSICYVSIEGLTPKQTGTGMVVYDNMPIPKRYICVNLAVGNNEQMPLYPICARILAGDSKLVIHSYDNTKALYGSFSYPVQLP